MYPPALLSGQTRTWPKPYPRTALPIEVMGPEGTVAAVTIELPQACAKQVSFLWLKVHGLEYLDLASVRVNDGRWVSPNNATTSVKQSGRAGCGRPAGAGVVAAGAIGALSAAAGVPLGVRLCCF